MIEKNILGYLITNPSHYYSCYQEINADMFLDPTNREIFKKYVELLQTDKPTLYALSKFFPYEYLSSLTPDFTVSITECVLELRNAYISHQLTFLGTQLAYGSVSERIAYIQDTLSKVMGSDVNQVTMISDGIDQVFASIKENRTRTGLSGIGTGFEKYDSFTGGLQRSDLVIIAGETSQGKTSFALGMARNAALRFGAKVCVFSYEMTEKQIITRLISQQSGVNSKRLMTAQISDEEYLTAKERVQQLRQTQLIVDPCKNTSIDYLINNLRAYKMKYGIQVAVVDYLQLLRGDKKESREQEVGTNTRRLKNMAKELEITIIALSQLSRDRGNPKPTLNRLRDSGQIEEAADQVLFVYRPEMYGIQRFEDTDISTEGMAVVILAKGRNVGVCSFYLNFDKYTTEFSNYSQHDFTTEPKDYTGTPF